MPALGCKPTRPLDRELFTNLHRPQHTKLRLIRDHRLQRMPKTTSSQALLLLFHTTAQGTRIQHDSSRHYFRQSIGTKPRETSKQTSADNQGIQHKHLAALPSPCSILAVQLPTRDVLTSLLILIFQSNDTKMRPWARRPQHLRPRKVQHQAVPSFN